MAVTREVDDFDVMILALLARVKQLQKDIEELRMARRVVLGGGFTKAQAVAAVEGESGLTFTGGLTLGGDLDLAGNDLLTTDLAFRQYSAQSFALRNRANTEWRDLRLRLIMCGEWSGYGSSTCYVRASTTPIGRLLFQVKVSGAWKDVMQIGRVGTEEAKVDIPMAGDITFLANKTLKIGNISGTGTPVTQTKYFPVDDGGLTRYIPMFNAVT